MENYKIFNKRTLTFEKGLNIFDGPNGYGKTSVFDAVEFIITGNIKRIATNSSINGTLAFREIFLANDSSKDLILKAEFETTEDGQPASSKFTLAKRISAVNSLTGSVERNPKKISDITETYLLPSFETEELKEEYLISRSDLPQVLTERFGETSQNMFAMLYYVQQEDRLDFFKQTERDRISSIDTLFQISEEKKKLEELNQAKKSLNKIVKALKEEIDGISSNISEEKKSPDSISPEYIRLFPQDIYWDAEELIFKNKQEYEQTIQTVLSIKMFINDYAHYAVDLKNRQCAAFLSLPDKEQGSRLLIHLLHSTIGENHSSYIDRLNNLRHFEKQQQLADKGLYAEVNYQQLAKLLNVESDFEYIQQLINDYRNYQSNGKTAQQTLQSVLNIRIQLKSKSTELLGEAASGVCQYCGYDWKDTVVLDQQFEATTKNLEKLADDSTQHSIDILEQLKKIYHQQYSVLIDNEKQIYFTDNLFKQFSQLYDATYMQIATELQRLFKMLHIENSFIFSDDQSHNTESILAMQNLIRSAIQTLPPEYDNNKKKFDYDLVDKSYFNVAGKAKEITVELIDKKMDYIRFAFLSSQQALLQKRDELKEKYELIKKTLAPQLSDYAAKWKQSISRYQAQIIAKIEIPF